ncbi:thioredoxin family protein [Gracilibacillus kekensis]|uniref:Thioredoxin-like fold domain-containing protein n=1 Tax=Gracilibacillus kekensis TaxID=1027249 RepID=A0A1M7QLJ1_9BACI|nr:hypothetical protein [Gracilibacillus kekensis]SHN31875.1 hypothetical protein SAMN05216179_3322 [Gracilibacillus kekensis]
MKKQIELYISDNCSEATQLIEFLNKMKIHFSIKNTTDNKDYLYELHTQNIYITPALIIDEYYQVLGFQQKKIEKLLRV